MRKDDKTRSYLRLVTLPADVGDHRTPQVVQLSLFPLATPSLLGLYALSSASAPAFVDVLTTIRPRYVIDVRVVPRFDFPRLTRALALEYFERLSSTYVDASAALEVRERRHASLNSGALSSFVNQLLSAHQSERAPGPLMFLLDDEEARNAGADVLPRTLRPQPRGGWVVHLF